MAAEDLIVQILGGGAMAGVLALGIIFLVIVLFGLYVYTAPALLPKEPSPENIDVRIGNEAILDSWFVKTNIPSMIKIIQNT